MLTNWNISKPTALLTLCLLCWAPATLRAAEFPVGMDWQRQLDYVKGEAESTPSAPTEESPWHYSWGDAAPDAVDIAAAQPLSWQTKWFGHTRGVWAQNPDRLPLVEQRNLNISLNPPKSIATCFIRWRNPSSKTISVKVVGTLTASWHGEAPSDDSPAPLQFSLFVFDHQGHAHDPLQQQSITEGSPEIVLATDEIALQPGDELIFAFRPEELPGGNRYITVTDDLTIKLTR